MNDGFAMDRRGGTARGDPIFLLIVASLAVWGLVTLYSASYGFASSLGKPQSYFVKRQILIFLPAAMALFAFFAYMPLEWMRSVTGIVMLASLGFLLLPFLPGIGVSKNGATRWVDLGITVIQPSEGFKISLILYLAHILSKKKDRMSDVVNATLPPLIVAGAGVLLVFLQDDFSTAFLLAMISIVIFWIADAPFLFFAGLASVAVPLSGLAILTSDYRLKRIIGFLAPSHDPSTITYQINASIRAIRSGGFSGKGLGLGTLKIRNIPEVQSDFIFAAFAEELGLAGVLLFCALLAGFAWRAARIVFSVEDGYPRIVAFGCSFYVALQTLINIAMVSGIMPATGIPLPFFSAGGSSFISVIVACALVYNVSRRRDTTGGNAVRPEAMHA